jgi:hypothetical protein
LFPLLFVLAPDLLQSIVNKAKDARLLILKIQDCLSLVHRVERRLVSTSIFMNQGGKLQLVNSLLSSLPTIYMCSIKIPIDIFNQIDKCI